MTGARLDVLEMWSRLNDDLIRLVAYVPEDRLNWSPKPGLWNFRGIMLHITYSRGVWFPAAVGDATPGPEILRTARSIPDIQEAYRQTWARIAALVSDPSKLDATYPGEGTGHRIAFHLLEHDIHHRADIFHYLALLDIDHPHVGTP